MLSILIPVYNYNINPLVEEIHLQATLCNIPFEIIVVDDASPQIQFNTKTLEAWANVKLILLKKNIGRSAIRNLLASKAEYGNLLFIDAGTFPKSKTFISTYTKHIEKSVVIGGMVEEEKTPNKPYKLRWLYTKKKEANSNENILTSANFLIKKSIIQNFPFDEGIISYGYEDLLFFKTLKSKAITLHFVNNPVIHDCKEEANIFINKTEQGLHNLLKLSKSHHKLLKDSKIIKLSQKLSSVKLSWLVVGLFKITKPFLLKNFNSANPSILLFDFYKLGYFCTLKQKR